MLRFACVSYSAFNRHPARVPSALAPLSVILARTPTPAHTNTRGVGAAANSPPSCPLLLLSESAFTLCRDPHRPLPSPQSTSLHGPHHTRPLVKFRSSVPPSRTHCCWYSAHTPYALPLPSAFPPPLLSSPSFVPNTPSSFTVLVRHVDVAELGACIWHAWCEWWRGGGSVCACHVTSSCRCMPPLTDEALVHALVAEEVEAEGETVLVLGARLVHQLHVTVVGLAID